MDMLIGFLTGLWIVIIIAGVGLTIKELYDSNLEGVTKLVMTIWLVFGNLYAIQTIIGWSLLLVDKL